MKIAEDSDFNMLKSLVDDDNSWKLEYNKESNATEVRIRFFEFFGKIPFAAVWCSFFAQALLFA